MKIKANEFRIGNLIDTPYGILPIYGISKNCIEVEYNSEDVSIYDFNLDECKPIPIIEEWLLKFGFIANGISYKLENNNYLIELYFYDCWNLNYIEKEKFGNGNVKLKGYWNIHQLQNLYFALTGNELEIFD